MCNSVSSVHWSVFPLCEIVFLLCLYIFLKITVIKAFFFSLDFGLSGILTSCVPEDYNFFAKRMLSCCCLGYWLFRLKNLIFFSRFLIVFQLIGRESLIRFLKEPNWRSFWLNSFFYEFFFWDFIIIIICSKVLVFVLRLYLFTDVFIWLVANDFDFYYLLSFFPSKGITEYF